MADVGDEHRTDVTICPICMATASELIENFRGYREDLSFTVFECAYCDVQFVSPMAIPDGLYESIYGAADSLPHYHRYSGYRSAVKAETNPLKWLAEREPAFWFISQELPKLPKRAKILEVGSGLGYLTYAIKQAGFDIRGIDISQTAIDEAIERFGEFYSKQDLASLAAAEPQSFDAVIMTEVIEHVPNPALFIEWIAKLLKPGAKALITTPNKSSFAYNCCWRTENPPVHLWWFSETTLRKLAQGSRLSIKFADFSSMYNLPLISQTKAVQEPAWLTKEGTVTREGHYYVARGRQQTALLRNLKTALKHYCPALLVLMKIKNEYPTIMQRNYTMGAVLSKPL